MKETKITKPQIVEAVSIIYRRRRLLMNFKEECEMLSMGPKESEKLLETIPTVYQERYDEIVDEFKRNLEKLSNDMIENEFFSCEPIDS
ncbi:hypothetical protein [Streptococcus cuniculi]|uniref:Uncharacterized protein n=1 Tax=Streptococcus cuniculi TaxID=1432788 RepID=A0A4Y9JDY9_9STRE|nr:hypothetical protein [Streptococcus cuniculi]MBF0777856.1 hypothetical protein [Streptococcus cuniculi]TFU98154.1 hypothetical protein E4T82_03855 [Streptococcus cuniculi]